MSSLPDGPSSNANLICVSQNKTNCDLEWYLVGYDGQPLSTSNPDAVSFVGQGS